MGRQRPHSIGAAVAEREAFQGQDIQSSKDFLDSVLLVVEFQLYHDHSSLNRAELERQVVWRQLNSAEDCRRKSYRPRRVDAVLILGSRAELPSSHGDFPGVRILFLDELLESLAGREPDSPLAAALAPLRAPLEELEKDAENLYRKIKQSGCLREDDREVLDGVFVNLLLQRFKTKSREEIRKMIAELTPLQETRAGRELYQEAIGKGIVKGIAEGIERGIEKGIEKGERALALRQLERKFPAILARALPLVEALEGPELLAFGEELVLFQRGEDCLEWLERLRR